jgi:hypothetical protein
MLSSVSELRADASISHCGGAPDLVHVILCQWTPERTLLSATGGAPVLVHVILCQGTPERTLLSATGEALFWCMLSSVNGPLSGRLYQPLVGTLIWGMLYFLATSDGAPDLVHFIFSVNLWKSP